MAEISIPSTTHGQRAAIRCPRQCNLPPTPCPRKIGNIFVHRLAVLSATTRTASSRSSFQTNRLEGADTSLSKRDRRRQAIADSNKESSRATDWAKGARESFRSTCPPIPANRAAPHAMRHGAGNLPSGRQGRVPPSGAKQPLGYPAARQPAASRSRGKPPVAGKMTRAAQLKSESVGPGAGPTTLSSTSPVTHGFKAICRGFGQHPTDRLRPFAARLRLSTSFPRLSKG